MMTAVGRVTAVLMALRAHKQSAATYVIRNIVASTWFMSDTWLSRRAPLWPDAKTPEVLRTCKALEQSGEIRRVPTSYATMLTWELTDAGREFLARVCGVK